MTCRGRGCLEIKPSPNPFFQTTSADIGVNAHNQIDWKIDGKAPPFNSSAQHSDGNFLFLYSRESEVIGSKVPKPVVVPTSAARITLSLSLYPLFNI